MPNVENNFLKSKMNKDLDSRILPNGEYRDAQNLQISRSQGSEVGEFENILGNEQLTYLYTGRNGTSYTGKIIGQFTDETNNSIYIYSSGFSGSGMCPRDLVVTATPGVLQTGVTTFSLHDANGVPVNPQVLGVQEGMLLWGDNWNGVPSGAGGQEVDPIVTNITNTNITVSQPVTFANSGGIGVPGDTIYIGFANTIHKYDIDTGVLTLLVNGSFLNFEQSYRIFGINLIDDLLFWTDNRNQPRKINVELANPALLPIPNHYQTEDQISVAKYYPYKTPLVLKQTIREATGGAQDTIRKGYALTMPDTSNINIGDIVSGFPGQDEKELWNVIYIDPNVSITIYNNFKDGDPAFPGGAQLPGNGTLTFPLDLTFSNTEIKNSAEQRNLNGFKSRALSAVGVYAAGTAIEFLYSYNNIVGGANPDPSPQPTPQVGDLLTTGDAVPAGIEVQGSGTGTILISDEVAITEVTSINPGSFSAVAARIELKFNKDLEILAVNNDVVVSANQNFDRNFTGDPDLIEEKFVRFSYRFKFEDNEYSLAAPYTQICFIPKNIGLFGGGRNDSLQDMTNAYDSTIVEWFENLADTVSLKIPLPDDATSATEALDNLINGQKVTQIDILYKESDALSSKIVETIDVNNGLLSGIEEIPNTTGAGPEFYYNFDYKSIKPYRTIPTSEQNRVYDNVPIKALAQEITANRVMYGNFIQKHTPPNGIDYEVINADKSVLFNNYAQYPNHSVKQNRNYQVGFVLSDRFGRASSVVLSSNDNDPNTAGSTIYIPYKRWEEVGGPEAQSATGGPVPPGVTPDIYSATYSWLGNALRVKVNNGITQITKNSTTGEPGLYKSYEDTSVDSFSIPVAGTGYLIGDVCTTNPAPGLRGLGTGFTFEVAGIDGAGGITGIKILNRGTGYQNDALLFVAGGTGANAQVRVVVFEPNPLGWQSYKLVVKQQEQEYYNVYLPGYVSGYPAGLARDYGRIAFSSVFGDNINKIPRDLQDVGPLQSEFSTEVGLFGRVNNPSISNLSGKGVPNYYLQRFLAWNTQYFPGRIKDEVVQIGPIGQGGLELANSPFDPNATQGEFSNVTTVYDSAGAAVGANAQLPWGNAPAEQSFYNVEINPLAAVIKIGSEESQPQLTQPQGNELNTLGAKVTPIPLPPPPPAIPSNVNTFSMVPFLTVSETEPVESQLEIFYESSTSGNFVELNRSVTADYAGVAGVSESVGSWAEDDPIGTDIIAGFNFEDGAGNPLVLDGVPVITSVVDGNGVAQSTSLFTLIETVPTVYDDFDLETNALFWYEADALAKTYTLSFETTYTTGTPPNQVTYVDTLTNVITVTLSNVAPSISGFTPAQTTDASQLGIEQACSKPGGTAGYDTTMTGVFGQFTGGVNGSADVANNTNQLCFELTNVTAPGGTATWAIDPNNGELSLTGGTIVDGSYFFECTLTDATSPLCTPSAGSLTDVCEYELVFGTPPVNQALCFGYVDPLYFDWQSVCTTTCPGGSASGYQQPMEVGFLRSDVPINGKAGTILGSGSTTLLQAMDAAQVAIDPGFSSDSFERVETSGGGQNGQNLFYYNVKKEANTAYPPVPKFGCGFPPANPVFTTGELKQGEFRLRVKLSKGVSPSAGTNTYQTYFMVGYRTITDAGVQGAWTAATYKEKTTALGCPTTTTVFGAGVTQYELLQVDFVPACENYIEYVFDQPGEYFVRNSGVTTGSQACRLGGPTKHCDGIFTVEWEDAVYGPTVNPGFTSPCGDCNGPL